MDFSNLKILIVDDDQVYRTYLESIVTKVLKAQAQVFENPIKALDWLRSNTPNLIILDMEMPGLDGYSTLKKIRSEPHTSAIPVIPCTSLTSKELIVKLAQLKITDYIHKSNQSDLIVKKIGLALKNLI